MNTHTEAAMRALGFVAPESPTPPEEKPVPSFDGGARRDQPAPSSETHGAWLGRVLRGEFTP